MAASRHAVTALTTPGAACVALMDCHSRPNQCVLRFEEAMKCAFVIGRSGLLFRLIILKKRSCPEQDLMRFPVLGRLYVHHLVRFRSGNLDVMRDDPCTVLEPL